MGVEGQVRPEVLRMSRPRHGGDVWDYGEVRDYSSNVNPLGPPERLNEYIAEASHGLCNYPDDASVELKTALSSHYHIPVENILVGAGSAELIRLFPEVFIRPGDRVVMPCPTFSEYAFGCRLMGGRITDMALSEEDGFRIDVGQTIGLMVPGTKAVYICNPNNPTARMLSRKEVLEIVSAAAQRDIMVFLDETLLELSERDSDVSCVSDVEGRDNLFIIRSFTKSFAMPGLRIGYAFAGRQAARYLDAARLSWSLGTIEQRVATRLMNEEQSHVRKAVSMLVSEKDRMHHRLGHILPFKPSLPDSYFFFSPIHHLGVSSSEFRSRMLKMNVLVRDCTSFGGPCSRYSRFCVKTPEKDDEFLEAMRATVEEIEAGR